jgi:hypothetical protein
LICNDVSHLKNLLALLQPPSVKMRMAPVECQLLSWEEEGMRWIGLVCDLALLLTGVVMLLYRYRVLGKAPGVDAQYDAAMARQAPMNTILTWVILSMAFIGLLNHFVGWLL